MAYDVDSLNLRVEREFVRHTAHTEQAFAVRAAAALLAMRPNPDSAETRSAVRTFEAAARVVLRMAGLPADREEADHA